MKKIRLKIENESKSNVIQYLPYGVTTLDMRVEEDKDYMEGFIYPQNGSFGRNNLYVGYADGNKDFLVIWGAGKQDGLQVNKKNINERLFLQILHQGKSITHQIISLCHSRQLMPITKIELAPAIEDINVIRMKLRQEGESCQISFIGNIMPLYYSRWFPPRSSQDRSIQFYNIEPPPILITFNAKRDNFSTVVNSDIDIFLGKEKIGQVTGDWRYSRLHTELFTVFGDSKYVVLRLWLYWIDRTYSKNIFLGGDALLKAQGMPEDEKAKRNLYETFDIECPDIERFDFLIDIKRKKVSWVGTDLHYQEYWYALNEADYVKARIANDVETIVHVLKNLKNRFNPCENFDPVESLKKILIKSYNKKLDFEIIPEIEEYLISDLDDRGDIAYRKKGITRKHVPYVENGKVIAQLVSSVVTK